MSSLMKWAILIGRLDFLLYVHGTSNMKSTVMAAIRITHARHCSAYDHVQCESRMRAHAYTVCGVQLQSASSCFAALSLQVFSWTFLSYSNLRRIFSFLLVPFVFVVLSLLFLHVICFSPSLVDVKGRGLGGIPRA